MHDGMATPRMLVVPDADEPYSVSIYFYFVFVFRISISISFRTGNSIDVLVLFCEQPLPAGMAVSLEDNRANIDSVLKQIPEMFANNRHGSPVGTAAVKACIEALKPHGGRVLAFMVSYFHSAVRAISMTSCVFVYIYLFMLCSQGTQPTGGFGKLTNRAAQAQNVGAKEAEKEPLKYLAPGDKMYTKMAAEAAEYQVSVDLFLLTNNQYVDVASLGTLPRITGGSLYR